MAQVAQATDLVTLKEASEMAGVPVATLRFWIGRKELRSWKRGDGRRLVSFAEVEARKAKWAEVTPEDQGR